MRRSRFDYESLRPFADTPRQHEVLDALQGATVEIAAKALKLSQRKVYESVAAMKKKAAEAAAKGYAPGHWQDGVAPGYIMGKVTVQRANGVVERTWERQHPDDVARAEAIREAAAALAEDLPRLPPVMAPGAVQAALTTVYTITDAHVGALCWHREGGADWDLKIAERILGGCVSLLLDATPAAETGIVAQLGDFLHQDSINAVTPTSGHLLDADGRFTKVVRVAVQTLRRIVSNALRKHKNVVVLLAEGNHDISSSIWLRTLFAALYENEPRVRVIDSPLPYYAHRHGKTMLGWHHGHLKKNDQLPLLFAAQFPQIWGETTKRYVHTGHRHHAEEREHSGMTVVQHPTLAARDAFAARGGWIAERKASAITYHAEHGEVGRVTVTPEMVV
jgi:hypothetical protein